MLLFARPGATVIAWWRGGAGKSGILHTGGSSAGESNGRMIRQPAKNDAFHRPVMLYAFGRCVTLTPLLRR
jgi:hypothetical protein